MRYKEEQNERKPQWLRDQEPTTKGFWPDSLALDVDFSLDTGTEHIWVANDRFC